MVGIESAYSRHVVGMESAYSRLMGGKISLIGYNSGADIERKNKYTTLKGAFASFFNFLLV